MHASPSIYGMHMAAWQEYGAISLSTYSDNMDVGYGVPVIQQSHHVRQEGLEIPILIQKRAGYILLDFMMI